MRQGVGLLHKKPKEELQLGQVRSFPREISITESKDILNIYELGAGARYLSK